MTKRMTARQGAQAERDAHRKKLRRDLEKVERILDLTAGSMTMDYDEVGRLMYSVGLLYSEEDVHSYYITTLNSMAKSAKNYIRRLIKWSFSRPSRYRVCAGGL